MGIGDKIKGKVHRHWLARQSLAQLQNRLRKRRGVLGLCYHALDGALDSYPYRSSPEAFDNQLAFLSEIFDVVSVQRAVDLLNEGATLQRDRPVAMVCFDDGYRCNWIDATPILERHNIPATLFAARDLIRQPGKTYLSEQELGTLALHPLWDIGGHGITHNMLPGFLPEDQIYEIEQSRAWLEDLLGGSPNGFAYPQGQFSPTVLTATQASFRYGLSTDQRLKNAYDPFQIRRFCPTMEHDDVHAFAQALVLAPFETGQT